MEALSMSIADSCYEPKNFENWKVALDDTTAKQNDIYKPRDYPLIEFSKNDFTFTYNRELCCSRISTIPC